jgi:CTP synthase (UTP-ammonia lyase)
MIAPGRIGLIGDFDPTFRPHVAATDALQHAAAGVGCVVEACWVPTESIDAGAPAAELERFDGLWATPCPRPYKSLDGALAAIRFARERNWPFVGT